MVKYLGDTSLSADVCKDFGSKARHLHELLMNDYPVPAGYVINVGSSQFEVETIGGFPVAVRSSGALEDLPGASFAGLYETFLFVNSYSELQEAIQKCFDSRHSERVKDYLKAKGMETTPESLKMSVLVQKMVDAEIAGVLFTMNPTNGFEEECYLEYCQGVGERLVSGHVTPSQCRYHWIEERKVSETINDEGTVLSDRHLKELIDYSLKIQAFYGHPQDIEWAIDKSGKLYILQSRPITTFSPREDLPELTNADLKDGGVSARVCTRMMFSLYREALQHSMGGYFKNINLIRHDEGIQWIYSQYGRVYWNAHEVKTGLKKIPDFKEEDFDRDLGIQKKYGPNGPHRTPVSLTSIVEAVPVLLGLTKEFRDCENMVDQFRDAFVKRDEELKEKISHLARMTEDDFYRWLQDVIYFQKDTEQKYFRVVYNNSNFQTEFKSFIKKQKGFEIGDEVDLMGELHGVAHLDVQADLYALKNIADFYGFDSGKYYAKRNDFLRVHYHHGPAELDLTVARWGENTEWIDELVRSFVPSPSLAKGTFQNTKLRIAARMFPWNRRKFFQFLERSRQFLRIREEMRSFSTRAYYLIRLGLLEFAKRNRLTEKELFMLDIDEVRKKIIYRDRFHFPDLMKRIYAYEGYKNFKAPNEFGGAIEARVHSYEDGQLKGLGCSPGEFIGTARVILDIHSTHQLTKEDILITAFTDPGWTPVLAKVGGVVTEVGGLLSHAAVIGREYGIPAILNLIDATVIIQDGDRIKMNGKTGIVEVLEKGPKGHT